MIKDQVSACMYVAKRSGYVLRMPCSSTSALTHCGTAPTTQLPRQGTYKPAALMLYPSELYKMNDSRKGGSGPCIEYDDMRQTAVYIYAFPNAAAVVIVGVGAGNAFSVHRYCFRSRYCNALNSLEQPFRPNI